MVLAPCWQMSRPSAINGRGWDHVRVREKGASSDRIVLTSSLEVGLKRSAVKQAALPDPATANPDPATALNQKIHSGAKRPLDHTPFRMCSLSRFD